MKHELCTGAARRSRLQACRSAWPAACLVGLAAGSAAAHQASAGAASGVPLRPDAVEEAQAPPRPVAPTRPEQRKGEADRPERFAPAAAQPSSPVFANQPDGGRIAGFDFYRDPLNAKRPMQTFAETMAADVRDRPRVMDMQRRLLAARYNLTPQLDDHARMTRGKPLAVGPTARLPEGLSWDRLGTLAPQEVRRQGLFPYPSLPHPKQATGGQVFPQMQIDMFPRLQRFERTPPKRLRRLPPRGRPPADQRSRIRGVRLARPVSCVGAARCTVNTEFEFRMAARDA